MELLEAKAVILTFLAKHSDGLAFTIDLEWKLKIAKAKEVLKANSTYAMMKDGMYLTIKQSSKPGWYVLDWQSPKAEVATATDSLSDAYAKVMAQLQQGQAPSVVTEPDLSKV